MKKIAIVSFHRADNYGAVLQNYALQQAAQKKGVEAYTADLRCSYIEKGYKNQLLPNAQGNVLRGIYYFALNLVNYRKKAQHIEAFSSFRNSNLRFTKTVNTLSEIEADYDVFITGSDQVWNKKITGRERLDDYLLDTIKHKKKASYAGSCGHVSNLDEDIISKIEKLDYITVRESTTAETLRKYIKKEIVVVSDPVFLLSRDEWISKLSAFKKRSNKYMLLYYSRPDELEVAKYISSKLHLEILHPCTRDITTLFGVKCNYEDGPLEFVNDILNAQLVVASSFHAIAFSVILEKDFIAVLNVKSDTRAGDLLKKVGLENRIVMGLQDYINKKEQLGTIDYTEVRERVAKWREESMRKLERICLEI